MSGELSNALKARAAGHAMMDERSLEPDAPSA
jgi:hypothetical protein